MQVRDVKSDGSPEPTVSELNVAREFVNSESKLKITTSDRPEAYFLNFEFHKLANITIQQEGGAQLLLPTEQKSYRLVWPHDSSYAFKITGETNGEVKEIWFRGRTPKDIILQNKIELTRDTSFEAYRIYLLNSQLKTNGYKLQLHAVKFFTKNSRIYTFESDERAPLDQVGRSGGVVDIRAKWAAGYLQLDLNGQDGGDGSLAKEHKNRAESGFAALGARVKMGDYGIECIGSGVSNGSGKDGAKGFSGNNGKAGGASALLLLNIIESDNFKFDLKNFGGRAGQPSKGGVGQLGGLPGATNIRGAAGSCPLPKMIGKEGKAGPRGDDGIKELEGTRIEPCINLANQNPSCLI